MTHVPIDPDVAVAAPRHVLHPRHWDVLAVIAIGGALGSLARWGLAQALPTGGGALPWATLIANVSGALLLGLLMAVIAPRRPQRYLRPFLGIGVLGGYTTFSTYALETRDLLADDHVPLAFGYLLGSTVAGLCAVWVGWRVGATVAASVRHRRGDRTPGPGSPA